MLLSFRWNKNVIRWDSSDYDNFENDNIKPMWHLCDLKLEYNSERPLLRVFHHLPLHSYTAVLKNDSVKQKFEIFRSQRVSQKFVLNFALLSVVITERNKNMEIWYNFVF